MAKPPIFPGAPTPKDSDIKKWNKALKALKDKRAELKKEIDKNSSDDRKRRKLTDQERSLRAKVAALPPIAFYYADKQNMSTPVD